MIRLALVSLALSTAAAFADTPLTRLADGRLAAPVRVGHGAPAQFVIDTGAGGCTVTKAFAQSRRLLAVGASQVRAPAVELDGARLGALTCTVVDDGFAAGSIGADALQRYVVVLDGRRRMLSLHGGAQHGQALVSPRARLIYDRRTDVGPLVVPVRLNGARGEGAIDTGIARSHISRRLADAAGAAPGEAAAFDLAGVATMKIAAPPVLEGERPEMWIGLDRLARYRLVLDYPRRRVWFDPG